MGIAALFRPRQSDDNRRSSRFKVLLPIRVWRGETSTPAQLVELSNRGARARALSQPEPSDRVTIDWEGKQLSGAVIWVKGEAFGIEFDRVLSNNQLLAMLAD